MERDLTLPSGCGQESSAFGAGQVLWTVVAKTERQESHGMEHPDVLHTNENNKFHFNQN